MLRIFIKGHFKEIITSVFFITVIILLCVIILKQKEMRVTHDLLDIKLDLIDSQLDKNIGKIEKQNDAINHLIELLIEQQSKSLSVEEERHKLKKLFDNLMAQGKDINSDGKGMVKLLSKESELVDKEKAAYKLYKAGKYGQAYKIYDEIREIDPSRIKARYYRVCSMYYSNPMDVNSFEGIVEEIQYLRSNGIIEPELSKIEAGIQTERDMLRRE